MFRLASTISSPLHRSYRLSSPSCYVLGGIRSSSGLSPMRRRAAIEEQFLVALRSVRDPMLRELARAPDVVSQGLVRGVEVDVAKKTATLDVLLPTAAYGANSLTALQEACTQACANAAASDQHHALFGTSNSGGESSSGAENSKANPWAVMLRTAIATPHRTHGFAHQSRLAGGGVSALQSLPSVEAAANKNGSGGSGAGSTASSSGSSGAIPPSLSRVQHIVAVASCKGGVGKSTVAANLAYALAGRGGRVGLLDMDIYGPSLPTLLSRAHDGSGNDNGKDNSSSSSGDAAAVSHPTVRRSREHDHMVLPVDCDGVRALSFGWVSRKSGVPGAGGAEAAVVRGPVASKVATQLLLGTDWGTLDYLVVDMPPGTGDVHLTVSQLCSLSGAVVVTTPHPLSHADVLKGVAMYETLKVPTLAVVENMAYLETPGNGTTRLHPFGLPGGHLPSLCKALGVPFDSDKGCARPELGLQLPISTVLSSANAHGKPLMLDYPGRQHKEATSLSETEEEEFKAAAAPFESLADYVVQRCYEDQFASAAAPTVSWDAKKQQVVVRWLENDDAMQEVRLSPKALRDSDPHDGSFTNPQAPQAAASHDAAAGGGHVHGPGCGHTEAEQRGDFDTDALLAKAAKVEPEPAVIPLSIDPRGNYAVRIKWSDGFEHPFFSHNALLVAAKRHLAASNTSTETTSDDDSLQK